MVIVPAAFMAAAMLPITNGAATARSKDRSKLITGSPIHEVVATADTEWLSMRPVRPDAV